MPALRRLPPGQDTVPFHVEADGGGGRVGFDRYDVVSQRFTSNHVSVVDGVGRFREIPFRYVWPAELGLMARIAGCDWSTGGPTGRERRSRPTVTRMCRCGPSRSSDDWGGSPGSGASGRT